MKDLTILKNSEWNLDLISEDIYTLGDSLKIKNSSADKIKIDYNKKLTIRDIGKKCLTIKCDCDFTNAGGYMDINGGIIVPLNGEVSMEITPPVTINIKLVIQAESDVELKKIILQTSNDMRDLTEKLSDEPNVLVITPSYPSLDNLYSCAFAHSRNKEYSANGINVQVVSVNPWNWYQTSYIHDGLSILKCSYKDLKKLLAKKQYKVIVTHFADEFLYPIFDGYIDNEKLIFICHGPETVFKYLVNVTRPYFVPPVEDYKIEEQFAVKEKYVRRYSQKDNVEWVFVSDWLKEYSEEQLNIKFKNSRVINNVINEDLFPYSPKKAEDRCKILVIRKFDNICQHSIDQVVLAISALSQKEFFNELTFEIYGDGNYYDVLVAPLLKYENVHLHRSFIPNNRINLLYAQNGILLIPSRHDAHAVAMGEGAASGMVVVGSRVTSNPFFMNEKVNHTLADPEDHLELAGIIERLYNDPDEFLAISQRLSEETHNNYCKEKTVKKEIELIKEKLKEFSSDKKYDFKPSESPVLTIAIPAYNVEKYIEKCINSIITASKINDIEVLVINDGSTDKTAEIVDRYDKITNGVVKLITKENGGHGSTINTAIQLSRGKYFRLVDGDDWVDSENLSKLVEILKKTDSDIVLTKGSYEYVESAELADIIKYDNLKEGKVYQFDDLVYEGYGFNTYGPLLTTGNYKTKLLKEAGFKISEKKPYVDMEFNSFSLKLVKTLEYHALDIYRYLIGREGQTISREFWKRKYKDHMYVIFNILDNVVSSDEFSESKKHYIFNKIIANMVDSQIFMFDCVCRLQDIDEFLEKLKTYGDIYNICIKYITDKKGNCDLILKTYKTVIKRGNSDKSIVIPGVRETVNDLANYPVCKNYLSAGFVKKAVKAVTPYGLLKLARIIRNKLEG